MGASFVAHKSCCMAKLGPYPPGLTQVPVQAVESHTALLDRKKKDLAAFQTKWKIRLKGSPEANALENSAGGQGVLCE